MFDALQFEFMKHAVLSAILASIACGIIGSYVVVKKMSHITGGIAHTAFGGIGLGFFLNVNPLLCILPFSLIAAWTIGLMKKQGKVSEDTAIGILWATGMALGIIFIALSRGYVPDLFSYLFGNILTVSTADLWLMGFLNLFIITNILLFYSQFLAISFDEEYAQASGIATTFFYLLLLSLISLTVVMLIRIVEIILVIALLTIPSAIAKQYVNSLGKMMFLSMALSLILTLSGLYLSYWLDIPSGATIILLSAIVFLFSAAFKYFQTKASR